MKHWCMVQFLNMRVFQAVPMNDPRSNIIKVFHIVIDCKFLEKRTGPKDIRGTLSELM